MVAKRRIRKTIAKRKPRTARTMRRKFSKAMVLSRGQNIVPSRLFQWMTVNEMGYLSSGAMTNRGDFNFDLNYPVTAFNSTGGTGFLLPNSIFGTSGNPAGLKNMLLNPSTNTGLYEYGRVWRVKGQVTFVPQTNTDNLMVSVNPVTSAAAVYGNVVTARQAPYARTKVIEANTSAKANTIFFDYSLPTIVGVKKSEYGAQSANTYFTYATGPNQPLYAQVTWQQLWNSNLSNAVAIEIKLRYFIEWFQRTDTSLLDT